MIQVTDRTFAGDVEARMNHADYAVLQCELAAAVADLRAYARLCAAMANVSGSSAGHVKAAAARATAGQLERFLDDLTTTHG